MDDDIVSSIWKHIAVDNPRNRISDSIWSKRIGKIIDENNIPTTTETKKAIDMFISPIGVFSRKNIAMIKELYLGKIVYFLNQQITDMANNDTIKTESIISLILDIMELISPKDVFENIKTNIMQIKLPTFRKMIKDNWYH